jgi:feruloyl-CoA synthase
MLPPSEREQFPGSIGRPTPGVRYRIEGGELQLRTPFIMSGYLDDEALTNAALCDGFLRTGDLAREQDGVVYLEGRAKELISRAGNKISPLEIEAAFADHPAVASVLATGVADTLIGERIHMLIVPRAGALPDEIELRRWGAERLEKFKRPDVIHFGPELPLGPTGKADRGALRRLLAEATR